MLSYIKINTAPHENIFTIAIGCISTCAVLTLFQSLQYICSYETM